MAADYVSQTFKAQATTDAYVTLGKVWNRTQYRAAMVSLTNAGSNGAHFKIEGSLDGTIFFSIVAETVLAAGATTLQHLGVFFPFVRVQIKSQGAGSATSVRGQALAYDGPPSAGASDVSITGTPSVSIAGTPTVNSTLIPPPGAVPCAIYAEAAAATASDALITLTKQLGTAAPTTGTSIGPSSGKTLRILGGEITIVRATITTVAHARVRIRVNTGGAASLTSPIFWTDRLSEQGAVVAVAQVADHTPIVLPQQFIDIPNGGGLAVSHLNSTTTIFTTDLILVGYEY